MDWFIWIGICFSCAGICAAFLTGVTLRQIYITKADEIVELQEHISDLEDAVSTGLDYVRETYNIAWPDSENILMDLNEMREILGMKPIDEDTADDEAMMRGLIDSGRGMVDKDE